tara:strand:+ start:846 stop:1004 length:159 start_codon:yes stop_codon:yes gene_type:complete
VDVRDILIGFEEDGGNDVRCCCDGDIDVGGEEDGPNVSDKAILFVDGGRTGT